MAKLASKHNNMENLSFTDFSGGLNLIVPAEALAPNEMQEATNFEFSPEAGLFKVRGGTSLVIEFDKKVEDIFPIIGTNSCLVRAGEDMYRLANGEAVLVGHVVVEPGQSGSFEYWGESGGVVCCFGGPLYYYDGQNGQFGEITDTNAPQHASAVFYRIGRIAVVDSTIDTIFYSGVGDIHSWVHDPDDDQTSQFIEIGYNDGCDIQAVGELGGELIIFKAPPGQPEQGRVYRLAGEFPNWSVLLYSKGIGAWNSRAVQVLGDDLLFITKEGIASLTTAETFGDYRLNWPGLKINPRFSRRVNSACRIWALALRGQVWFWDGTGSEVFIYHYQIGGGAWTKFVLPGIPATVAPVSGRVFIGIENAVYEMADTTNQDSLIGVSGELEEKPILAFWRPKTVIRRNQILCKMVITNYSCASSSLADIVVEGLRVRLDPTDLLVGDIAFLDDDVAALDQDWLTTNTSAVIRKRCQFTRWNITPRLEIVNGAFYIISVVLEIAEV